MTLNTRENASVAAASDVLAEDFSSLMHILLKVFFWSILHARNKLIFCLQILYV
jgi:hypothetical protein